MPAVAMQAKQAKRDKNAHLDTNVVLVPVAVKTSGVLGPEALLFLLVLGHSLKDATGEQQSIPV